MIHSRRKEPDEVFEFCRIAQGFATKVPIVAVPSSYNVVTEQQLIDAGVRIVIYANHLMRAAYPQMRRVAQMILENGRSKEADELMAPISEALEIIPGNR
jgi:phosphoenolpyruvate phosphomutase